MVVLIYAPKRIHFGDKTYDMRVYLAVLDWVGWLVTIYLTSKQSLLLNFILSVKQLHFTVHSVYKIDVPF